AIWKPIKPAAPVTKNFIFFLRGVDIPFYISADFTLACGWDHLLCRVLPARREVKGVFSGKTAVAKADK
ncbi:hypothetical protein, partial [Klebsiella pneumoniae]|uniref:hypothetical protein n=1 Tax=Klebsiella pneumoniae TaxID=573 RepID=UPI001C80BC3A